MADANTPDAAAPATPPRNSASSRRHRPLLRQQLRPQRPLPPRRKKPSLLLPKSK